MSSRAAPLIYINALPGTGKLTIAQSLVILLSASAPNTSAILLDNHTLIDPVAAKYARDHPMYAEERRKERERVLEMYVENPERAKEVVIVTDCRATIGADVAIAQEFRDSARRAGRVFVPVGLVCAASENMRRLASEGRKRSGTTKLTEVKVAKQIRVSHEIFRFGVREEMVLDVTNLSPEEAAQNTMEWMMTVAVIDTSHFGEEENEFKKL